LVLILLMVRVFSLTLIRRALYAARQASVALPARNFIPLSHSIPTVPRSLGHRDLLPPPAAREAPRARGFGSTRRVAQQEAQRAQPGAESAVLIGAFSKIPEAAPMGGSGVEVV
jgi:hypothetical protein